MGDETRNTYLIWSHKHSAWWGPNNRGYFPRLEHAGRYSREDAIEICALARDGWDGEGRPSEIPVCEADVDECRAIFEAKRPRR